jgi:peptide-methionine (S)-S-oxide reductase
MGDSVVSVSYALKPDPSSRASKFGDNAAKLTESLPFDVGDVRFVLGSGNYLEGLHAAVSQMEVGDERKAVSIDAGAGEYSEGGCATVPLEQAPQGLKAGTAVMLTVGAGQQVQATVTEMTSETFTLDTNHPLAGVRFLMDVSLTAKAPASEMVRAVFAGGCFWGLELAYQREPGVVGTAVGYTQGSTEEPTYEAVCSGSTR